jgi:hypothetical protein
MHLRTSIDLDDIVFPRQSSLALVHFTCGMIYAWTKHVASEVLCAPILLTPISNGVRISSIIYTMIIVASLSWCDEHKRLHERIEHWGGFKLI